MGVDPPQQRRRPVWAQLLAGAVLGGTVADYWVNWLSGQYGFLGGLALTLVIGAIGLLGWLHREVPTDAPLVKLLRRILLAVAFVLAVTSTALSGKAVTGAVTAAVFLVAIATLIPRPGSQPGIALAGVAFVGSGVALVALSVAVLLDHDSLLGAAAGLGLGVTTAAIGIALLYGYERLRGVAGLGIGVALAALGIAILLDHDTAFGAALLAFGVADVATGVADLLNRDTFFGFGLVGAGVAAAALGVAALLDHDSLFGVALLASSVSLAAFGVAIMLEHGMLFHASGLGCGAAIIVLGVALLLDHATLLGVAIMGGGVALLIGVFSFGSLQWADFAVRRVWRRLLSSPSVQQPSPDTAAPETEASE